MKYLESLKKLGLTSDQAKIYEVLISSPVLPVRIISRQAGVGRELSYVVLSQLEDMGLVEKSTQSKIILFHALHPENINKILEQKKSEVTTAEKTYENILQMMIGDFNVTHNKPFIKFYDGLGGLEKSYGHIIRHAKTVRVIRSLYDYENKEIRAMVTEQLQKQSQKGIRSYVLSPKLPHMKSEKLIHNLEKNITRKVVPIEKLSLPAQVVMYNNTVSITSMRGEIVTTVIENKDVAETFLTLFNYMWDRED